MTEWLEALDPFASPLRTYMVSVVVSILSGLVPVVNIEAYLVSVALLAPEAGFLIVLIATAGQMAAKYILYVSGRDALLPRAGRHAAKLERAGKQLRDHRYGTFSVVAFSAFVGLPPFYAVSIMAGVMRLPLMRFMVISTVCRVARFALFFYSPAWIPWPWW